MKKKVIFLIRAYNDFDCRLPLMLEFEKDKKYNVVEVVGIPTNAGINDPGKHELAVILFKRKINITSIYDLMKSKYMIKVLYLFYKFFNRVLKIGLLDKLFWQLKRIIFKAIFYLSVKDQRWIYGLLKYLQSSILIIDEIAFSRGRSFFVDELIKNRLKFNYSIYSFLTGQDTYLNLWHDKETDKIYKNNFEVGIPLFVPGENDKIVMEKDLPNENIEVIGNTRFDASWITTLSEISSKNIIRDSLLSKSFEKKIVFMLSKIEYGVDLKNIAEIINVCAGINNSCVIVKPHTRGMSLDELKGQLSKRVYNGLKYSSSDLIQWADTVLFTGSSIIFQAIQLKKQVIFLKYCQRYKTIFDNSNALLIADNIKDVIEFIDSGSSNLSQKDEDDFLIKNVYAGQISGLICRSAKERIETIEKEGHYNI